MFNYLNYINENKFTDSQNTWANTKSLTKKSFTELLNTKCSDVDLNNDNPIFRSINLDKNYYLIENKGIRKSAYTSNFYTMLMNNLPSWEDYPKRQHICTNVPFNYHGNNYRVIPFNGAKIGVCPGNDIQASFFGYFSNGRTLQKLGVYDMNGLTIFFEFSFFDYLKTIKNKMDFTITNNLNKFNDDSWNILKNQLKEMNDYLKRILKKTNINRRKISGENYNIITRIINKLLIFTDENKLNDLLNPDGLGFELYDYKDDYNRKSYSNVILDEPIARMHGGSDEKQREIWLDSDILLIKSDLVDKIL